MRSISITLILLLVGLSKNLEQVPEQTQKLFYHLSLDQSKEQLEKIIMNDSLNFKAQKINTYYVYYPLKQNPVLDSNPDEVRIFIHEGRSVSDSMPYKEIVLSLDFSKVRYEEAKKTYYHLVSVLKPEYLSFSISNEPTSISHYGSDIRNKKMANVQISRFYTDHEKKTPKLKMFWADAGNDYDAVISIFYRLN